MSDLSPIGADLIPPASWVAERAAADGPVADAAHRPAWSGVGPLVELCLALMAAHPGLRRLAYRTFFQVLARRSQDAAWWTCMNYGYAPCDGPPGDAPVPPHAGAEAAERTSLQLYDHVAAAVPLAGREVLEVGCGEGRHLIQIAKAFPEARCIGVDIDPTGMKQAREAFAKARLDKRIELVAGEIGDAVADGSVDAVVMIEVLHEIAPGIRQAVIDGCAKALAPEGWLLIVDETYPSTLAQAREADYLFPVQTGFEELTWGNVLPTRAEQDTLLADAGFTDVQRSAVGDIFTVITARKA